MLEGTEEEHPPSFTVVFYEERCRGHILLSLLSPTGDLGPGARSEVLSGEGW